MFGALDHFDAVTEHLLCPVDQLACVDAVYEDRRESVEAAEEPHPHRAGRDPVPDTGGMHNHREQVAFRVDGDVPLAAFDFFARVAASTPLLAASQALRRQLR
jgi:hypothetical protein